MKKLFTILFGLGLMTSAAFAQDYRRQDEQANRYQQSQYSHDHDGYNRGEGDLHREAQYASRDRDDRFRGGDRDDRFRGGDRDDHYRRVEQYPVQYGRRYDNDDRYQRRPSILPALIGGVIIGSILSR